MKNSNKYFVVSNSDRDWGLYILNCGSVFQKSYESLKTDKHPEAYRFSWEKGRILQEYQLIYIVDGYGKFESATSDVTDLHPGYIMCIFPGVWHRYRPDKRKTWNTYWVGFNGPMADSMVLKSGISHERPVIRIGYQEKILDLFLDILTVSQDEFIGYQQVISGYILQLFGWLYAFKKKAEFKDHNIDGIIQTARLTLMQTNMDLTMEDVAESLNIGYSKFRKLFRHYTGMSPGQYQVQHRINRAIRMLNDEQKSIKEIAFELGFDSAPYFSRLFKSKTGYSPGKYRKQGNKNSKITY